MILSQYSCTPHSHQVKVLESVNVKKSLNENANYLPLCLMVVLFLIASI